MQKIKRRDFIKVSLSAATVGIIGTNIETSGSIAHQTDSAVTKFETLSLEQLDLNKIELAPGLKISVDKLRTDKGVRLPPGSSFWIDLKNSAETFTATVEADTASSSKPVKCRFSTGAEFTDVIFYPDDFAPRTINLLLKGRNTLIIETESIQSGDGFTIVLSNSAISYSGAKPEAFTAAPIVWETADWKAKIDGKTGAIIELINPRDSHSMNWIHPKGRWGNGLIRIGEEKEAWLRPSAVKQKDKRIEITYNTPKLKVTVKRGIDNRGLLGESYTFHNNTGKELKLEKGAVGILTPLSDYYPGADVCLTGCCNVHHWSGGHFAYLNAVRMGGDAPHLGLVLTNGTISNYSIDNRPQTSDDRGWFVLHPGAMTLAPKENRTVSWTMFWHQGWNDFHEKAAKITDFVRLEARKYTVLPGEPILITAASESSLKGAKLFADGKEIKAQLSGETLKAEFLPDKFGEQIIELEINKKRTLLRAFVTVPPLELIETRVKFIIKTQQKRASGDPLDGSYLIYDNETKEQIYSERNDHNAGRERLAMGVLGALYLPFCQDEKLKREILESLLRYETFVQRELEDETGTVFNNVGRQNTGRLYNYPWSAHLHLAMYHATKQLDYLQRFTRICRTFYQKGGAKFYPIGIPIMNGLSTLKAAGLENERAELLKLFRNHADALLKTGTDYPKSEVNYEQSIVAPAAQILLEIYLATNEKVYLEGAKKQLVCLEAFNGKQPDYHLNDIAVRHWDAYWFGKKRQFGDTQPHYWSTITAIVFDLYARATGEKSYAERAQGIANNNLCNFFADGSASCAYVNPLTINGKPGQYFDPWANDQDWALVNWLTVQK